MLLLYTDLGWPRGATRFGSCLTCWNITAAQIMLKDKDDIDALCPTNSAP